MLSNRRTTNLVALAIIMLMVSVSSSATLAADLLPHQATYKMSLASASRPSGLVGVQGVMAYRTARGCDGWTVENTTYLRLSYDNEADVETKWTFASWESNNGLEFRFHTRLIENDAVVEKIRGHASLEADGSGGTAWLALPKETTIPLPAGTLFPTDHMRALIAAAESGVTTFSRVIFDGASVDNPYVVNAVLRPVPEAERDEAARNLGLPPLPMWSIHLGFFPYRSRDSMPEFELGARHRADGVADRISQQFDDFSLKVELQDFKVLPKPDC